jgi:hypothetical protein
VEHPRGLAPKPNKNTSMQVKRYSRKGPLPAEDPKVIGRLRAQLIELLLSPHVGRRGGAAGGGGRVAGGGWRVAGGGWRVAGGGWRVAGGGWRVEILTSSRPRSKRRVPRTPATHKVDAPPRGPLR